MYNQRNQEQRVVKRSLSQITVKVSKWILLHLVEIKTLMSLNTLQGYCKLSLKNKPNITNKLGVKNKLN